MKTSFLFRKIIDFIMRCSVVNGLKQWRSKDSKKQEEGGVSESKKPFAPIIDEVPERAQGQSVDLEKQKAYIVHESGKQLARIIDETPKRETNHGIRSKTARKNKERKEREEEKRKLGNINMMNSLLAKEQELCKARDQAKHWMIEAHRSMETKKVAGKRDFEKTVTSKSREVLEVELEQAEKKYQESRSLNSSFGDKWAATCYKRLCYNQIIALRGQLY